MIEATAETLGGRSQPVKDAPAVQVREVRKAFGDQEVVSGVTFEVPRGTFCTLLGASGSGKTTTLRMLAGLERVDDGEISLGSRVVSSKSVFVLPEHRRVGLVFQSYALWPHMTVFDHVAYPMRVQRGNDRPDKASIRDRVEASLELVDLGALGKRYPFELSGGQQQRVALARAIVHEPEVLLLDEPLSNLDADLRGYMRRELRRLHERLNLSTVYVTHDQLEALALSDEVIVMHHGRIIERGTPREVYERPKTLESARFLGASNILAGSVVAHRRSAVSVALDNGIELSIPAARFVPQAAVSKFKLADRVAITIKPEDVHLASERSGVAISAEVERSSYHGSHTEVTMRVAGEHWRVWTTASLHLHTGQAVDLALDVERITAFPTEAKDGA